MDAQERPRAVLLVGLVQLYAGACTCLRTYAGTRVVVEYLISLNHFPLGRGRRLQQQPPGARARERERENTGPAQFELSRG